MGGGEIGSEGGWAKEGAKEGAKGGLQGVMRHVFSVCFFFLVRAAPSKATTAQSALRVCQVYKRVRA